MSVSKLTWKWDDGFYFAHASYGHWTIEQRRGRFYISLDLSGAHPSGTQDFGYAPTGAKAQAEVNRAHRALSKLD
jgi:hypothetical protein